MTPPLTILSVLAKPKVAVTMKGHIGGKPIYAAGDQGAVTSIICASLVKHLGLTGQISPLSTPIAVQVGTGHTQEAEGTLSLDFDLDDHPFHHDFLVVPNFSGLFLLGIDFFTAHHWVKPSALEDYYVMDFVKRVQFSAHPLRLETDPMPVVTSRGFTIPVGTTMHALGRITGDHAATAQPGMDGIMRPAFVDAKPIPGLEVPNTVARVYASQGHHQVRIMMVNTARQPIHVPAGTQVGVFSINVYAGVVNPGDDPSPTSSAQDPDSLPDQAFIERVKEMSLDPTMAAELLEIIFKWRGIFAANPSKPHLNRLMFHHIDTGDAAPVKRRPYNTSPAEDEKIREEVLRMLENGIVRPSNSPWASPVILVKKNCGGTRFCYDARYVNSVTKKDSYTLPRVKDLLRRFRGAKFFSVCDAAAGYWSVPLAEDSIEKTAFITNFGLFEFLVMPFGLTNAPATYQRLMNLVLGNLTWECVSVFVDDCCIYSPTWADHIRDLDRVFSRFAEARISLKLSKCFFGQRDVRYLGLRLSADGHGTDPAKLQAVRDMVAPKNHAELQSVMGLLGYYRPYIPHFADIAEPLLALGRYHTASPPAQQPRKGPKQRGHHPTYKPQPWVWTEVEQQAFDTLRERLMTAPIIAYPDFSGRYPFLLETDASSVGTGAVLTQRYPDRDVVIGYYSYTLKKGERKWSTTEREAFAIVKAVRFFRNLLAGTPFTVVTDHASLRYLMTMKDPFGRISRWIMELQQYDMMIDHRAGIKHGNADGLTRPPVIQLPESFTDLCQVGTILATGAVQGLPPTSEPLPISDVPSVHEIQIQQRADPVLQGYISFLQHGSLVPVPEDIRPLLLDLDNYSLVDGVLYHSWTYPAADGQPISRLRLVVPPGLRRSILFAHHENSMGGGHFGFRGTYDRIRRNYMWPNMRADVHSWVRSCITCACRKHSRQGPTAGLKPIPTFERPFEMISMDFLGPLPVSSTGNKYILVVNDYATRYPLAFALKTADGPEVARVLVDHVILEYGPPQTILSDRGSHFLNALVDSILQLFSINHVFSSGYRPQTAGLTERMNQTLVDLLAMYVDRNQRNWDQILPYVLFSYRTLYNPVVKNVPFYLLYGYEPVLPHELYLLPPHINQSLADQERNKVAERLNHARRLARNTLHKIQLATAARVDAHRRQPPSYRPGDLVMAFQPYIPRGGAKKLAPDIYQGPYRVERFMPGMRTLRLVHIRTGLPRIAHIDNTKPYVPSELREELPDAPEPTPTEQEQHRALDQLERACAVARHVVGQGRARATVAHILGHLQLPPLPPQLQAVRPLAPEPGPTTVPPLVISAPRASPTPSVAAPDGVMPLPVVPATTPGNMDADGVMPLAMDVDPLPEEAQPPMALPPVPPAPIALPNPNSSWSNRHEPWFSSTTRAGPTYGPGTSRSGRALVRPDRIIMLVMI